MAIKVPIISTFDPKGFKKAETTLDKFGKVANAALAGFAAAGTLAAKAAIEDAKSAETLAQTMRNVTGATDQAISANEDFISQLTLSTGVADDQLRPALDRLIRSTGNVAQSQDLLQVAMDVSAGTGKDLQTVTEALARANEGSFTSLKRLGIPIDENIIKSKDFDAALSSLASTFSGQMDVAANSTAGQFQRLQVGLAETQETIGYALLPIIEQLLPYLQRMAKWVSENTRTVIILSGVILTLAVGIKIAQAAIAIYSNWSKIMTAATWAMTAAQTAFNAVMALNPVTLIVIAVIALVAALVLAYKKSETFRNIVDGAFKWVKDSAAKMLEFFKKIPGYFVQSGKTLVNAITTPYRLAFAGIAKLWNATLGGIKFEVPSWIPGIGGKGFTFPKLPEGIPALADGGIVTKPTLALIGEAGPEAVVPLNKRNTPGGGINITINGAIDPEGTARAIQRVLTQSQRRAGAY